MGRFSARSDIATGVIGYGPAFDMGKKHLTEMAKAGMRPTAVAELDPARLEAARNDFPGIETYPSAEEMLEKSGVNLVAVLTPHNSHAELAIKCLEAGRHVVVEKPFAITTEQCDAMISAAAERALMVTAYHNRHWDGWIMRAVEEVRRGVVGEVFRVECRMGGYSRPGNWWRTSKSISGGILYDWGVHLLEYAFQIIDSEIVEVSGYAKTGFWGPQTKWGEDANEDEGFAVIRFADGRWVTLPMSSLESNPKPGFLEIAGTLGTYLVDFREWQVIVHEGDVTVTRRGRHPPEEGWRFYDNVAAHLTTGEPLVITPEWARRPIHVIELACESARTGRALEARYH